MIRYAYLVLFLLAILLHACNSNTEKNYGQKPDAELENKILNQIIRHCGYMPKKANDRTKFDAVYDTFYMDQATKHRIDLMYTDPKSGYTYLLVSRIAPSLTYKRVGIGIKMRTEGDSLTYYEELFRTWKMTEEILAQKGGMLFGKMVAGKDLSPYYPQNSGEEEYIEFPDMQTRYSVEKRRWITEREFDIEQLSRPK